MEIRIYFGKTPTDNAKFFTRADFMDWYNRISQNQYVSIQTDEIITPFFNFIDIGESAGVSYIWNYTYIGFIADDSNQQDRTFFAVIDRIENTPFDGPNNQYRIYFHCDWWSTLQFSKGNFDEIFGHLRGGVTRAHVNDWVDNGDNTISPTMQFTDTTLEETVNNWRTRSIVVSDLLLSNHNPLYASGDYPKIKFLCVIYRIQQEGEEGIQIDSGARGCIVEDSTGELTIPTPFGFAVIPILNGRFIRFTRNGGDTFYNTKYESYACTTITGDRAISMFITDYIGIDWILQQTSDGHYYVNINNDSSLTKVSFPLNTSEEYVDGLIFNNIKAEKFPIQNLLSFGGGSDYSDTKLSKIGFDLDMFNSIGMSKFGFSPYKIFGITGQKSGVIIRPQFMTKSSTIEFIISPNSGCGYCRVDEFDRQGLSNLYELPGDNTFTVFSQQNYLDERLAKISAISSVLQPILSNAENKVNGATSAYNSINKKEPNFVNAGGSILNTAISSAKNRLEQEVAIANAENIFHEIALGGNVQISPNYEGSTITTSAIKMYEIEPLYDSNKNEIKQHLRMYGYTTYLEPCDVLLNHKRSHFNYIQTENVYFDFNINQINYSSNTQNIKDYIINMFNSGVFLFRTVDIPTTEVMSFDVINMQEGILE